MTPETKTKLKAARALIADPLHWTKFVAARDARGDQATAAEGVCFCSVGALWRACGGHREADTPIAELEDALRARGLSGSLAKFNDGPYTTHEMVLELFDQAIGEPA